MAPEYDQPSDGGPPTPASDRDCSQDYTGTQPMTQPLDLLDGSSVDQSMELSQDEWEGPQVKMLK